LTSRRAARRTAGAPSFSRVAAPRARYARGASTADSTMPAEASRRRGASPWVRPRGSSSRARRGAVFSLSAVVSPRPSPISSHHAPLSLPLSAPRRQVDAKAPTPNAVHLATYGVRAEDADRDPVVFARAADARATDENARARAEAHDDASDDATRARRDPSGMFPSTAAASRAFGDILTQKRRGQAVASGARWRDARASVGKER